MSKRDYYEVLGAKRDASPDELKGAYRKLAMQLHPDRNHGDAEAEHRFKELNEAYDVLKDAQKRAAYDRFGHRAFEGSGAGPRGGSDFGSSFSDVFDDLFGDFMGRGRGQGPRPLRGQDLRYNLEVTLSEAFAGKQSQIRVPASMTCEVCEGTGAEAGSRPVTCPTCSGVGKVRAQQGFFTIERACPNCSGAGRIVKNPCKACSGQGRVQRERTLSVNIPMGVEDGTRIRLAGEGEAGHRGGPNGDLYIFLSVAPHSIYRREGADLFCRVPVSLASAALGGAVEVPTIDGGKAKVAVPEGTQSGRQFRIRHKGMPTLRGGAVGDLYIEVQVETPVKLTKKQKEILRQFEEAASEENHPESAGFFSRMRDLLNPRG